jgi:hypothetical protein
MTFGLTDVDVEYTEADFQNLTTYKLFQQHVRPLLGKENPKVKRSTEFTSHHKCILGFLQSVFLHFFSCTFLLNRFLCQSL